MRAPASRRRADATAVGGSVDRGQPLAAGREQCAEHADRTAELERVGERPVAARRERRLRTCRRS